MCRMYNFFELLHDTSQGRRTPKILGHHRLDPSPLSIQENNMVKSVISSPCVPSCISLWRCAWSRQFFCPFWCTLRPKCKSGRGLPNLRRALRLRGRRRFDFLLPAHFLSACSESFHRSSVEKTGRNTWKSLPSFYSHWQTWTAPEKLNSYTIDRV